MIDYCNTLATHCTEKNQLNCNQLMNCIKHYVWFLYNTNFMQ